MKTKTIFANLEQFFSKSKIEKSNKIEIEKLNKLIEQLEKKEQKFRDKISELEEDADIPKYRRKLNMTEKHIAKAKAHKIKLESN